MDGSLGDTGEVADIRKWSLTSEEEAAEKVVGYVAVAFSCMKAKMGVYIAAHIRSASHSTHIRAASGWLRRHGGQ